LISFDADKSCRRKLPTRAADERFDAYAQARPELA